MSESPEVSDRGDVTVGLGDLVSGKVIVDCGETRTGLKGMLLLVFLCRFNGKVIPSNWERCIPAPLRPRSATESGLFFVGYQPKFCQIEPTGLSINLSKRLI